MAQIDACPDCGKTIEIGEWPLPCHGAGHELGSFWKGDSQIHASEKVVVYEQDGTGALKIPGRGDRPIHPKLAAEGWRRKVLDTTAEVREVERKTKTMHEAGSYHNHSSQAMKDTGSI